jgi:hypothetical protein
MESMEVWKADLDNSTQEPIRYEGSLTPS